MVTPGPAREQRGAVFAGNICMTRDGTLRQ